MSPLAPAARRALGRYGAAGPLARAYAAARLATCPFEAVLAALPARGPLLDVGCGAGLLCHLAATRGLEAVGIDPDPRKVALARASLRAGDRVSFAEGGLDQAPLGPYGAVAFVDVLYLEAPDEQARLLAAAAARLQAGGRVVVKTTYAGGLKGLLTEAQEWAAVRALGLTRGRTVRLGAEGLVADALAAAGLRVSARRIDRGYPHPHLLVVGQAP